jgi:hypothetical protein
MKNISITEYLAKIGRKGGSANSPAQIAAKRLNAEKARAAKASKSALKKQKNEIAK